MNSSEVPRPETPQERAARMKEYYQQAIDEGRMNAGLVFGKMFSNGQDPATLTHDFLDRVGREMNKHWTGDPRSKYHR